VIGIGGGSLQRLQNICGNFRMIMRRQMRLNWLTQGYAQVAVVFPLLVILSRYFAKQIGWGGLMQGLSIAGPYQAT
jgi:vitamin B12/bleomycin/antimicrobial peptide transport system ATP-binding/permease protein